MADGFINIDTAIDSSNIDREVQKINKKLNNVGSNMKGIGKRMNKDMSAEFNTLESS